MALLAAHVEQVGTAYSGLRGRWQRATEREVQRRERHEAGRGLLRLCMRAWREAADRVPAGAARFDQRWARGDDCPLARRLAINTAALTRWGEAEWLPARLILSWMRLVRAGAVRRARERAPAHRAAWAARCHAAYECTLPHLVAHDERGERAAARGQGRLQRQRSAQRRERSHPQQRDGQRKRAAPPADEPVRRTAAGHHAQQPHRRSVEHGDQASDTPSGSDSDSDEAGPDGPTERRQRKESCVPSDTNLMDEEETGPRRAHIHTDTLRAGTGGGRKSDRSLSMRPVARSAYRWHLTHDDARGRHARRARGDG